MTENPGLLKGRIQTKHLKSTKRKQWPKNQWKPLRSIKEKPCPRNLRKLKNNEWKIHIIINKIIFNNNFINFFYKFLDYEFILKKSHKI